MCTEYYSLRYSISTVSYTHLDVYKRQAAYPGLAANEFLCLSAARRAQIEVPGFDLSHDGQVLVLDRFDVLPDLSLIHI